MPLDPSEEKNLSAIMSMLTTEQYNLQSGRSITVSESTGRASLFLSTVSTTLVALSFIGGFSQTAFRLFALLLFPSLFFLGLVTFQRVLQTSLDDVMYARGIARIRHFYTEVAPHIAEYFVMPTTDDAESTYGDMASRSVWWQVYLTLPGMIGVIDSLLVGVFVGLVASFLLGLPLPLCVGIGAIGFVLTLLAFYRYQWVTWSRSQNDLVTLFPKEKEGVRQQSLNAS